MTLDDPWSPKKPAPRAPKLSSTPASLPPLGAPRKSPADPFFSSPPRQPAIPGQSPYDRFLASMVIDYEAWHDGTGYDLAALKELTPQQRTSIEQLLIQHSPRDWRDIEALGHLDTPAARAAVIAALTHPDASVRREAQTYAPDHIDPKKREHFLISAIHAANAGGITSQTLDEAAQFHPPAVIDALFRGTLNADGESAVHFAALLYFIHGQAAEPFDWSHRPFFLRFHEPNRTRREAAFRELCQNVGVDPKRYL